MDKTKEALRKLELHQKLVEQLRQLNQPTTNAHYMEAKVALDNLEDLVNQVIKGLK